MNRYLFRLACMGFVVPLVLHCDSNRSPVVPEPSGPQTAMIQGTVLIGGSAIGSAQVSITGPIATRTTTSGIDGRFAFGDLPPGVYTVRATLLGIACTSTTADVDAGETLTTSIDCASAEPQRRTTLRGTVTAGETPIGGIQVTLTGATFDTGTEVERAVMTDASGHFTFAQLADGAYTLTAEAPDVACETIAVHVQVGEPVTANISCAEENGGGPTPPPMDNAGRIAFERNGRIMILDLDTNNLFHFIDGLAPSWSPDGRRLVFQRPACRDRSLPPYSDCDDIWIVSADGSGLSPITSYGWVLDYDPVWSPDGSRIAFVRFVHGPDQSYLVVSDVDPPSPLWSERVLSQWWPYAQPTWSPDGTRIAFSCQGPPSNYGGLDICVEPVHKNVGYEGSGFGVVEKLTRDTWIDSDPAWSPDGARIAFTTNRDGGSPYIALVRPDGTGFTQLVSGSRPAWSPDGTRIVLVGGAELPPGLYIVNASGSDLTRITDNPTDAAPSWGR